MPRMLRHIVTGELWGYNAAMAEHPMVREYDPDHPEDWEHGEPEPEPTPNMHSAVATTAAEAIERAMAKAAEAGKVEVKQSSNTDDLAGLSPEELAVKQKEAEAELEALLAAENTKKNAPPPPPPPPPPSPPKAKK